MKKILNYALSFTVLALPVISSAFHILISSGRG